MPRTVADLDHRNLPKRIPWFLNSSDFYHQYSRLGLGHPIWRETEDFVRRLESSIDAGSLDRECVSLTDPADLRKILDEAEECFQREAKRSQNSQEFEKAIQLIQRVREPLIKQQPIQTSMIESLTFEMRRGKNWERLPESLYEQRVVLDGVLSAVCIAIERPEWWLPDRTLAEAAQTYIANNWMHSRWMTTLLASQMLYDLKYSVMKRERTLTRWWRHPMSIMFAGAALWKLPGIEYIGILLGAVGVVKGVEVWQIASTRSELERIYNEVESKIYAGRVLAERLDRLNRDRVDVPSILIEVLCQ